MTAPSPLPPGQVTTVHLLRHGEVHNPAGVLYGRLPGFRLSDDGLAMARTVADVLAQRPVAVLRTSPLERARQTAEPLAQRLGLEVSIDEQLLEAESHFEGKTYGVGDGALRHPANWSALRNPFRPSWGEPYAALAARMLRAATAARDLARATGAPGAEAVCVSHQLPIWTARRAAEGRVLWHRPDQRECGLASLTSLTYDGDRVVKVDYTEPAGPASRRPATPGA